MMDAEFYQGACARLRMENESMQDQIYGLQQTLAAIKNEDSNLGVRLVACFNTTPQCGRLLAALMRICPQPTSRECLTASAVKNVRSDCFKVVDVHMVRIRRVMKSIGQANGVKTIWGFGYCMSVETKDAIMEKLTAFEHRTSAVNLSAKAACYSLSADKLEAAE